jgi:hypothetical protein
VVVCYQNLKYPCFYLPRKKEKKCEVEILVHLM